MNYKQKNIKKAIAEIENTYPPNNLISNYKDFLRLRDYLPLYQFNPAVFDSLVTLTCDLWNTTEKINRKSLLEIIKGYVTKQKGQTLYTAYILKKAELYKFSNETNPKIFWLFKESFEGNLKLNIKGIQEIQKICNSLLININLQKEEIKWLCKNTENSELILNRVLRYPKSTSIITNWAKENFENDRYRSRRAEILSWAIDENPAFVIDKQVLIDDFEHLNSLDIKTIQEYEDEFTAKKIIEKEMYGRLPASSVSSFDYSAAEREISLMTALPALKLTHRFFSRTITLNKKIGIYVPDIDALRKEFYDSIEIYFKITMLWGIAYSRLDNNLKAEQMKKYYSDETYWTFLKIAKKFKNIELLKWLEERNK